jgi:hypothetical protein
MEGVHVADDNAPEIQCDEIKLIYGVHIERGDFNISGGSL